MRKLKKKNQKAPILNIYQIKGPRINCYQFVYSDTEDIDLKAPHQQFTNFKSFIDNFIFTLKMDEDGEGEELGDIWIIGDCKDWNLK